MLSSTLRKQSGLELEQNVNSLVLHPADQKSSNRFEWLVNLKFDHDNLNLLCGTQKGLRDEVDRVR